MVKVIDYATPGPFTVLDDVSLQALDPVATEPVAICLLVHSLVIQPTDAQLLNLPTTRFAENQIRPANALVRQLLALDSAPLTTPRDLAKRVVGTCRHFAVLACALLRCRGVAARARCGFATYFQPGQSLDHWITEYWDDDARRRVRIDAEILGQSLLSHPHDLSQGEFLSGGEAWIAYRRGEIDASTFGVYGTDNWGAAEIRGNAVKDLAALNKVETLPWDEWGQMTDAYQGTTGEAYDELLDDLAEVCARDDSEALTALYSHSELRVPDSLMQ